MEYQELKNLLLRARRLPADERESFLRRECGEDMQALAELRELLAHDNSPDPEILTPSVAGDALRSALFSGPMPERVGAYRLLELLGEGGMGVVYRARDEGPLGREVALKFLRFGINSASAHARFDAERSVLARMDHRGIAQVYDAGADEHGRPWVAMELVHGEPITRWCDENKAPIERRVRLLRDVCMAIQHAHQKGVLHRDLKPSNILVDVGDGSPRARVIDFGIAKGLDEAIGDQTLTLAGEFLGTPEYMSPEQAGSDPSNVDTRSDIYSLGVLLQELMVGDTPLGEDTRSGKSLPDLLMLLRERDVEAPTKALARLQPQRRREIADARDTRLQQLERTIRGDLSAIAQRALERNPERRYASAAEFAADLDRWLAGEPVEAAPPSRMRQFAALARRNRLAFTTLGAVLIMLILGLTTTLWQFRRAASERVVAEQRLEDIRSFVIDLVFEMDRQLRDLSGSDELRTLLAERCVEQLGRISEDARARERLRSSLGTAYRKLAIMQKEIGNLEAAAAAHSQSIALLEEETRVHPDSLQMRRELAVGYDSRATVHSLSGDDSASLEDSQRALAIFEELMAVDPTGQRRLHDLNICRASVAGKLFGLGRIEEGLAMRKLSIEGRRAAYREQPDDPNAVRLLAHEIRRLGNFHEDSGQLEQAAPYYEEAVTLGRRAVELEPRNPRALDQLAGSLRNYGRYFCYTDRHEQGLGILEESQELHRRLIRENPGRLRYVDALTFTVLSVGEIEMQRDRNETALVAFARADSLASEGHRINPTITIFAHHMAWARQLAGRTHEKVGEFSEAERQFRSGLSAIPPEMTEDDLVTAWRVASIECDLGGLQLRRADAAEAGQKLALATAADQWLDLGLAHIETLFVDQKLSQWQLDEREVVLRWSARVDSTIQALTP